MHVVVIGGGISGLVCAYRLSRAGSHIQTTVLEPASAGGLIQTHDSGRFLIEAGPDSVVVHKPEAVDLLRELDLGDQIIGSRERFSGAQLLIDGTLYDFPVGLLMRPFLDPDLLLKSSLLGSETRMRIARESAIPAGTEDDEPVGQFFERRLGSEFLKWIVEPVVAGVYGCNANNVSMRSAFPLLFETERTQGFVVRPAQAHPKPVARRSPFVTLKAGMGGLIQTLLRQLAGKCSLVPEAALELRRKEGKWIALTSHQAIEADRIIVALPAPLAGRILAGIDSRLSGLLAEIPYSRSLVGCFGFSNDVTSELSGTGVLVPQQEGIDVLACTAVHHKFSDRCRDGDSLVRLFIGADRAEDLWELPDSQLMRRMFSDLTSILGSDIGSPVEKRLFRWRRGLPEYRVGHHSKIDEIRDRVSVHQGLHLVGNFIDGVGISDCIRHANGVVSQLRGLE